MYIYRYTYACINVCVCVRESVSVCVCGRESERIRHIQCFGNMEQACYGCASTQYCSN